METDTDTRTIIADVAQKVERLPCKQRVAGSSPCRWHQKIDCDECRKFKRLLKTISERDRRWRKTPEGKAWGELKDKALGL